MLTEESEKNEVKEISNDDLMIELKSLRNEIKGAINNKKPFRISKASLIFGIISFFLSFGALYLIEGLRSNIDIKVGMTPFHVRDKEDLKSKYESDLKPVNESLRKASFTSFKKYILNVEFSKSYNDVFEDLSRGKIHMAFVSHAIFNCKLDSIDCTGFELIKTTKENNPLKPTVKLIGFKKIKDKKYYHSRLIWNKKQGMNIDDILKRINDTSIIVRLGHGLSVSTHLVPEIFLSQKGHYNIRNHKEEDVVSRADMLAEIFSNVSKNKTIIGALSDDDFERLEQKERDMLSSHAIGIEIPYDAILVNSDWWENLRKRGQKLIKRSFKKSVNHLGMTSDNDTTFLENCKKFKDLLDRNLGNYCPPKTNEQIEIGK